MGFIDEIKARAKADIKTIVLPETEDERTYKAAEQILKEGIANLILVGKEEEVEKNRGTYDISGAKIVDPATNEKTEPALPAEPCPHGCGRRPPESRFPETSDG